MNSRTLYIGDVHGCADELERIVDAFGFVRGKDTLYQTGDIINKGPDMLRALKFVKDNGILTVRGNHEEHSFMWPSKSMRTVTAAKKLKDACSLEE